MIIRSCLEILPRCRDLIFFLTVFITLTTSMSFPVGLLSGLSSCNQSIPQLQYSALYDLYVATNGPNWAWRNETNDFGAVWQFPPSGAENVSEIDLLEPCSQRWQGLMCDYESQDSCAIITISLALYNLVGFLPPSLESLIQLQILDVSSNSLTGTIPSTLGLLFELQNVDVAFNFLSGSIPSTFGSLSQLEYLDMNSNLLTGTVPTSLMQLSQLVSLDMGTNFICGTIQSTLGELLQLQYFSVISNSLSGIIPTSIGQLSQLKYLGLAENYVSGYIPSSLSKLSQLRELDISSNSLIGTIPSSMGELFHIINLGMSLNSLSGNIPTTLAQLSQLRYLDVDSNFLTGAIPTAMSNISNLQYLYLYSNLLSGSIPSSLGQLSHLNNLQLNNNLLSGLIPLTLGEMSQLVDLFLFFNFLTGTVHSSLGQLTSMRFLHLNQNSFEGSLPTSLQKMSSCVQLLVNGNQFSGKLELLFSSTASPVFPILELLDISDNSFTGTFPANILSLPTLRTLSASTNCFHGSLNPLNISADSSQLETIDMNGLSSGDNCRAEGVEQVVEVLFKLLNPGYLPSHLMSGSIPSVLWSLPKLTYLCLVGNGFTDSLDLGAYDIATSNLTSVSVAYNRLTGTIPIPLQLYGRFNFLDLSYNRFSGTLDSDFTFAVGDSAILNMSVNRLSGSIPTKHTNILASSTNLINTTLAGNLFRFVLSDVNPKIQSTAKLYNGSYQFDVSMALTSVMVISWLFLAVYAIYASLSVSTALYTHCGPSVVMTWWQASRQIAHRHMSLHFRRICSALLTVITTHFYMLAVSILLGVIIAILKSSPSVQSSYALYVVQYSWTWSLVYLQGTLPVILVAVCTIVLLLLYHCTYYPLTKTKISSEPVRGAERDNWATYAKRECIWVLLGVGTYALNATIMLIANELYVSALGNSHLTIIQITLASFKYCWSTGILWALKRLTIGLQNSRLVSFPALRLHVLVFNCIIAPSIVTALVDPSCFYELFNQTSESSLSGSLFTCADPTLQIIDSRPSVSCTRSGSTSSSTSLGSSGISVEPLAMPYHPPFMYNYQCGSALITNYVPVLLYKFFLSGFLVPALTMLIISYPAFVHRNVPVKLRKVLFAPVYMISDEESSGESSGESSRESSRDAFGEFSGETFGESRFRNLTIDLMYTSSDASMLTQQLLFITSKGQEGKLFEISLLMDNAALSSAVMVTFGLSTPYLAIVIMCSVLAQAIVFQLVIGRFLYIAQCVGPSAGASSCYEDASRWVEESVRNEWEGQYQTGHIIVIVAILFWGLVIFDLVGNSSGSAIASVVIVAWVLCVPLVLYWIGRASLQYLGTQKGPEQEPLQWQRSVSRQNSRGIEGHMLSEPFLPITK